MRAIRRNDNPPRLEMTPLLDVVFLLLTFFIYSMLVMVNAQVMPVTLTGLNSGKPVESARIDAITIDRDGVIHLNREPMELKDLGAVLKKLGADPKRGQIIVAMEEEGNKDRGPLFLEVIDLLRSSGIEHFGIAGRKSGEGGTNGP